MGNEMVRADEGNAVQVSQFQTRTVADIRTNASLIKDVLKSVLKKGVHYDLPYEGSEKYSLLKSGAEKILSVFLIGIRLKIEDMSKEDCRRYRIVAEGFHIPTGIVIGEGLGECSTDEKKYKWVKAICGEEYEGAEPSRRQLVWKRGKNGSKNYQEQQVRSNPADIANTVLKMAKKRAVIDLCLSATAASDIFDTNNENEGAENRHTPHASAQAPGQAVPPPSQAGAPLISEKQSKRLYAIQMNSKKTPEQVKEYLHSLGFQGSKDITIDAYEEIIAWIEAN